MPFGRKCSSSKALANRFHPALESGILRLEIGFVCFKKLIHLYLRVADERE